MNGDAYPLTYRVTHVDAQHRRRCIELQCSLRSAAEALAVAMWGDAVYMAAVRLRGSVLWGAA